MSGKKKSSSKSSVEKILLATAMLNLIAAIIELIGKLIE